MNGPNPQKYNAVDLDDEMDSLVSEIGWKYVHADVLRPPPAPLALAAATGAAAQLWGAAVATLALALLGIVSPTSRGRLLTAALTFTGVSAVPAGYTAARVYRQVSNLSSASLRPPRLASTYPCRRIPPAQPQAIHLPFNRWPAGIHAWCMGMGTQCCAQNARLVQCAVRTAFAVRSLPNQPHSLIAPPTAPCRSHSAREAAAGLSS
jgi:hypothetical protein